MVWPASVLQGLLLKPATEAIKPYIFRLLKHTSGDSTDVKLISMKGFGDLISTVQQNCHISDARFAGNYTMCIFLLKMREFYRWEHDIALTEPMARSEIGDWLVERENTWNEIEDRDYAPLNIGGQQIDPFEARKINDLLLPEGIVYSGGYGLHQKPHFFLGSLLATESRQGLTVHISSCEYARDLVAPPAMMLDNTVFIRQESLRRYLWERIEGWQFNKSNRDTPMGRALSDYGYTPNRIDGVLDRMTVDETEAVILHEVGEALAGKELGPDWEKMLASFPSSKTEYMVRAARDLLADCTFTLPELIAAENQASLHFYFANLTGMRRHLDPGLHEAYCRWTGGGSMNKLSESIKISRDHWLARCQGVVELFKEHGNLAADKIVVFLEPVTH